MLLSPTERIILLAILPPAEGNAFALRAVRRLRRDIAFSNEEIRAWKVCCPSAGNFTWDASIAHPVEIEIPEAAEGHLKDSLSAANDAGKLHEGLMDVYDKFFPEG
jgi:hypothetical protein